MRARSRLRTRARWRHHRACRAGAAARLADRVPHRRGVDIDREQIDAEAQRLDQAGGEHQAEATAHRSAAEGGARRRAGAAAIGPPDYDPTAAALGARAGDNRPAGHAHPRSAPQPASALARGGASLLQIGKVLATPRRRPPPATVISSIATSPTSSSGHDQAAQQNSMEIIKQQWRRTVHAQDEHRATGARRREIVKQFILRRGLL